MPIDPTDVRLCPPIIGRSVRELHPDVTGVPNRTLVNAGRTQGPDALRRPQSTLFQPKHPVACGTESRIVSGDYRGKPMLCMHFSKQVVQRVSGVLVQVAGWFVGQEQGRLHDEGTRDRNSLLLP